jgi:hypothetical protein
MIFFIMTISLAAAAFLGLIAGQLFSYSMIAPAILLTAFATVFLALGIAIPKLSR